MVLARNTYVVFSVCSYDTHVKDRDIVRFLTNRSHLDLFVAVSNVAVAYKLSELCPVEVL